MNFIKYLLTKQEVINSNLIAIFLWGVTVGLLMLAIFLWGVTVGLLMLAIFLWGVTVGLLMCYFMLKLRGF